MNTKEMIRIMQAHLTEKNIERRAIGGEWEPVANPDWNWWKFTFRIAPEPKKEGRWERAEIFKQCDAYYLVRGAPYRLDAMQCLVGFGGIDYRSPFDETVIVRSMVPLMFNAKSCYSLSSFDETYRPGIPVAAWFWREGEK